MKPYAQALRMARLALSEGKTGSRLAESLAEVSSLLTSEERERLAKRISQEYYFLGHAAHDPNLYKTCQAAADAKNKSEEKHLRILTYRTPMCSSCGLNQRNHCSLIGGKLINGPGDVPEAVVHRTADLLVNDQKLDHAEARLVASHSGSPTSRVSHLHERKVKANNYVDHSGDLKAEATSRKTAAILDTDGFLNAPQRGFQKNTKKRNAEVLGVGPVDDQDTSPGIREATYFSKIIDRDMVLELPMDRGKRIAMSPEIDSYTETAVPEKETKKSVLPGDPNFDPESLQASLRNVVKVASKLLSEGAVTLRVASKLNHRLNALIDHGARPDRKTKLIRRQLNALGGGLEL